MRLDLCFHPGPLDLDDPFAAADVVTRIVDLPTVDLPTDGSSTGEDPGRSTTPITVVAPAHWSSTAVEILARRFIRKRGVPAAVRPVDEPGVPCWLRRRVPDEEALSALPVNQRYGPETDVRRVIGRMVGAWTYHGWRRGYFDTEADARAFRLDLSHLLIHQMAAPNSPQWFNTGLHWAYGIVDDLDGYVSVDPATGRAVRPDPEATAGGDHPCFVHSCFIQSVRDDLAGEGGILDLLAVEARIARYGAGTGANFSAVRGRDEPLSRGGRASGLLAALDASDRAAALVTPSGSTRRPSKMVLVEPDHPDIEQYVDWKVAEERKVAALIAGSEGSEAASTSGPTDGGVDWRNPVYGTISGQNSNNSVRVTDRFLAAIAADAPWALTGRVDDRPRRMVQAVELWHRVAEAAWACADPGVQYDDTVNRWHTCPDSGRINASNSCSEYMFLDDTATTLASINLAAFVGPDLSVDIERFEHAVRLLILAMEVSVDVALYPSDFTAERTHRYRPLGLGHTNLGGVLMAAGVPYDSDRARDLCAAVTALLTGQAYRVSAQLAAERGSFEGFAPNREPMLRVVDNHRRAAHGQVDGYQDLAVAPRPLASDHPALQPLIDRARQRWDEALDLGRRHGFRHAQVSLIAPTGTIGLVMDCDTLGIEPEFSLTKVKTLADGGRLVVVNRAVESALQQLGYRPKVRAAILEHVNRAGTIEGAPGLVAEHLGVFDCAVPSGCGARAITAEAHLQMMAAAQPFLSGAISKTVNLPETATVDDCRRVYDRGAELGLKAVALYRDGCRRSQPLEAAAPTAGARV